MDRVHEVARESQEPGRIPEETDRVGELAARLGWTATLLLIARADAAASHKEAGVADLVSLAQRCQDPVVQGRVALHLLRMGELVGHLSLFPPPVILNVLSPADLAKMSLEDIQAIVSAGVSPQRILEIARGISPAPPWLAAWLAASCMMP